MCFTCFLCQFVFNKRFLKIYCLSVHSFFLVSFTSMYTTLKIISRKFLGVSLIWTLFSHVGAIFFKTALQCTIGRMGYWQKGTILIQSIHKSKKRENIAKSYMK